MTTRSYGEPATLRVFVPFDNSTTVRVGTWYEGVVGIADLQAELRAFTDDRDWAQFHTPKNLAMALSVEVSELLELFQWLTPEQSAHIAEVEPGSSRVREEIADVLAYLLRLADVLDIDVEQALSAKIEANAAKYPVETARGRATKYTDLPGAPK